MTTPAPVPQFDLFGAIMQGIMNTPAVWWNAFLQNPGPWLWIAAMLAGIVVLKIVSTRIGRSRRFSRR